jgi:replicative DNA helicase
MDRGEGAGVMSDAIAAKMPPQNLEAELSVIGCALLDCRLLDQLGPELRAEDFYREPHQILWREMLSLREGGKPVDYLILQEHLDRRGLLARVGGADFVVETTAIPPSVANGAHYGGIVIELAKVRRLIEALGLGLETCYSGRFDRPADELIADVEGKILGATRSGGVASVHEASKVVDDALAVIGVRETGHVSGLSTGLLEIDELLGGLGAGQLFILAARPGFGKTSLAIQIATHAALDVGKSVLFVSLEMSGQELGERILTVRARIPGTSIRNGRGLSDGDWSEMGLVRHELDSSRLAIDDAAKRSVSEIGSIARQRRSLHGLDLIVIDYLQLLSPAATRNSNRQEQVAQISRELKVLAKDCRVPVLALSQLSREVEKRDDQRPRLSDLRESGAIEQDADVVLFLHHDKKGIEPSELIVAKNRSGPTGFARLNYRKDYTLFESWPAIRAEPKVF